jgi:hypothetical protein
MKKLSVILILSLTLNSCGLFKKNKAIVQPETIVSITAFDLSEDKSVLSTKNDEVMVSIIFGSEIEGTWYANGYHLPIHVFDSANTIFIPEADTLATDQFCTKCEVWICLTEIDEDGSEDSTHNTLVGLANSIGYYALDTKSIVDDAIKDNDFLGFARIPYFTKKLSKEYTISGQDLLDKYAYKVTITNKTYNTEQ